MGDTGHVNLAQKLLDPGGYVWDQSGPLPTPPDYMGAAQRQGQSTRPNQSNPFASSQWTFDPATGQYTQNVSLNGGLGRAAESLSSLIAQNAGKGIMTGDQAREQAIESNFNQAKSRLDPQWAQNEESTRARLAAQGLDPTSQAAGAQMDTFGRARNDAYTSALANAISQGNETGSLIFNQNLQSAMAPYQQLSTLKGMTGGFASGTEADPYAAGAAAKYLADMEGYSAKQAGKNSKMQGASAGAGAIASMFSDERLKTDVQRLELEALPGVPFATWKWKGSGLPAAGVIAQDLEKVRPDLVHTDPATGYLKVDYSFLGA